MEPKPKTTPGRQRKPLPPETLAASAAAQDERKKAAIDPEHTLRPNSGWRKQKDLWKSATDDERRDYLYGMVLGDAVPTQSKSGKALLAKFFSIKVDELAPYMDVIDMADSARVLKINRNLFANFLLRDDQAVGKFFIGTQFGYQVRDPAHEGVESIDDGKDITIRVLTKDSIPTTHHEDDIPEAAEESSAPAGTRLQ